MNNKTPPLKEELPYILQIPTVLQKSKQFRLKTRIFCYVIYSRFNVDVFATYIKMKHAQL